MEHNEDNLVALQDANKHKSEKIYSSMLVSAIQNEDLSYIQEFLLSKDKRDELEKLCLKHKEKLITLLVEFLDEPLRLEAMEMIYALLGNPRYTESLSKKLIERSNDFNKLIYLKGKIDYFKHQTTVETTLCPENEFTE